MSRKIVITCALTGSQDTTAKNPAIPATPEEIATSAIDAAKAGASVVHIHVRDPETKLASMDEALYAEVVERIKDSGIDMIINLTTGPGARFLPGKDDQRNQQVEEVLAELLETAAAGKIPAAIEPDDLAFDDTMPQQTEELGEGDEQLDSAGPKIAVLKLDRSDAAEEWLVKMLMAIEPDLYDFEDEPMVFAGYGRGRAMEPYIGKGITIE